MKTKFTFLMQVLLLILSIGKLDAQTIMPDTSFNIGTGFNNTVYSVALQADGKIIVGGSFTSCNGQDRNYIVRLNADGSLDSSFITPVLNDGVYAVAVQSDGKILVGGSFGPTAGQPGTNKILRLNTDGTVDTTFNVGGTGFDNYVGVITLQPDGKILVGGGFSTYNNQYRFPFARLNTDGTLDTSFYNVSPGAGFNSNVYTITVQPDGKILVGGAFGSYGGQAGTQKIVRMNANGTLDSTFNTGTGFDNGPNNFALQADGKILVGGGFFNFNGQPQKFILRLNADGSKDSSFSLAGTGFDNSVSVIKVLPDGKILAGGHFTSYNGTSTRRLTRLNNDGSLDTNFTTGTGFSSGVLTVALQPDGKILAGGYFGQYNGQSQNRMVRLIDSTTLGAEDFGRKGLKIYPNPFADYIFIDAGNGKISKIEILDSSGKKVTSYTNPSISIDLKMLSKGIYFLRITKKDGSILTKKIIKK